MLDEGCVRVGDEVVLHYVWYSIVTCCIAVL